MEVSNSLSPSSLFDEFLFDQDGLLTQEEIDDILNSNLPQTEKIETRSKRLHDEDEEGKEKEYPAKQLKRNRRMTNNGPTRLSFSCPIFHAETIHGLPHTCNGINVKNMAEVRRHLTRPIRGRTAHLRFLKLCPTCNEDFIDQVIFESDHGYNGELCNNPQKVSKGDAALTQWHALCRLINRASQTLYPLTLTAPSSIESVTHQPTENPEPRRASSEALPASPGPLLKTSGKSISLQTEETSQTHQPDFQAYRTPPAPPPVLPPPTTTAPNTVYDFPAHGNAYLRNKNRVHKSYSLPNSGQKHTLSSDPHKAPYVAIGILLSNGESRQDKYRCVTPACASMTFARIADLKRHNLCRHGELGGVKPQIWCPVDGSAEGKRSMNAGGPAFQRKDKMMDHLERMHVGKVGL